ncbi:MAG: mannose-phosphate guanylyltransferase, partial [Verrucomicrobiota bacterium]
RTASAFGLWPIDALKSDFHQQRDRGERADGNKCYGRGLAHGPADLVGHQHSQTEAEGAAGQREQTIQRKLFGRFWNGYRERHRVLFIRLVRQKETGNVGDLLDQAISVLSVDMANPIYALILAGGSGERFWPLSRRARPKQILRLISDQTLLEETVARLDGLVPKERILILTNVEQEAAVRELLKNFPKENIVAEPAKRDTAAAVALGAGWVVARDHTATMLVLPADHVIENAKAFRETLSTAAKAAEETGSMVAIGIKPTWACPGFGYIEQGEPIDLRNEGGNIAIHRVLRFREKPNVDLAESFLRKGNFRWNAGMFVWSVATVLSEFNRHAPDLADFISQIRAPGQFETALRERFGKLPRISFDYAIMEKADRVLVVEASFDWDDVGSWTAVAKYFKNDADANAANCAITALDSTNNIVFDQDGETVALLGVHNLIVVRTRDALLICHRHQAEKIKNFIGKLPTGLQ